MAATVALAKSLFGSHVGNLMKTKIVFAILAVICIGLAVALIVVQKQTSDQQQTSVKQIGDFSNQLVSAQETLNNLRQVNLVLTNQLIQAEQQNTDLSNNLTATSSALNTTKTSLQNAQEQISTLNSRVGDLEAQNKELDERATALTNQIAALNAQIADTEARLAGSQNKNAFLEKELKEQLALKAELEQKFNDLSAVRAQVKKLREELFVARRLEWIRNGTEYTGQKGAQRLVQRNQQAFSTNTTATAKPRYDLNVEVNADGSVRVISDTNAPAATAPAH